MNQPPNKSSGRVSLLVVLWALAANLAAFFLLWLPVSADTKEAITMAVMPYLSLLQHRWPGDSELRLLLAYSQFPLYALLGLLCVAKPGFKVLGRIVLAAHLLASCCAWRQLNFEAGKLVTYATELE